MSVKLKLVDISPSDAYSADPDGALIVGDVIEFDEMPKFVTWEFEDTVPSYIASIEGFDYNNDTANGTNRRTGCRKSWIFHAVKFERA